MKKCYVDIAFLITFIVLLFLGVHTEREILSCSEKPKVDTFIVICPILNEYHSTIRNVSQDIDKFRKQESNKINKTAQLIRQGNRKLLIIDTKLDSILITLSDNDTLK